MRNYIGQDDLENAVADDMADNAVKNFLDKHAGEKKHEMHQIDILGRAEQVEAKPSLAVQDGDRSPVIRRAIERRGRGRLRPEVGENGMERHYQEDDERPKITQC